MGKSLIHNSSLLNVQRQTLFNLEQSIMIESFLPKPTVPNTTPVTTFNLKKPIGASMSQISAYVFEAL